MPARIVLVHDDTDFLVRAAAAIRAAGHDVIFLTANSSEITVTSPAITAKAVPRMWKLAGNAVSVPPGAMDLDRSARRTRDSDSA